MQINSYSITFMEKAVWKIVRVVFISGKGREKTGEINGYRSSFQPNTNEQNCSGKIFHPYS